MPTHANKKLVPVGVGRHTESTCREHFALDAKLTSLDILRTRLFTSSAICVNVQTMRRTALHVSVQGGWALMQILLARAAASELNVTAIQESFALSAIPVGASNFAEAAGPSTIPQLQHQAAVQRMPQRSHQKGDGNALPPKRPTIACNSLDTLPQKHSTEFQ